VRLENFKIFSRFFFLSGKLTRRKSGLWHSCHRIRDYSMYVVGLQPGFHKKSIVPHNLLVVEERPARHHLLLSTSLHCTFLSHTTTYHHHTHTVPYSMFMLPKVAHGELPSSEFIFVCTVLLVTESPGYAVNNNRLANSWYGTVLYWYRNRL
jgi:hypothetical protein